MCEKKKGSGTTEACRRLTESEALIYAVGIKVTLHFEQYFQFIPYIFFVLRHTPFNLYTIGKVMKFSK